MARSLPKQAVPQSRRRGWELVLPRLGALPLLPPLLLALITLLVLAAAYSVRPTVQIDMGGDYDSVFLRDFNGREIDAAGSSESYTWQAGQPALEVPGRRDGVWIATLEATAGQPDDALRGAALAVNDYRVDMPRRTARTMVAVIPPQVAAADRWRLDRVPPLVGGLEPPQGIVGKVTLAPARTYRWTRGESSIQLPNLGRGDWNVDLTVVTAHPNNAPLDTQILANGALLARIPDSATTRRVSLLVPAALMRRGDLELTLRSNTFADPRPLGVFVSEVVVAPAGPPGTLALSLPPWGAIGYSLVLVLGLYACLVLLWRVEIVGGLREAPVRRLESGWSFPNLLPALAVLGVILLGGWALAAHRFPTSFMLPGLAGLMLWSLLLLLALRPLTLWLFADKVQRANDEHDSSFIVHRSLFISLLLLIFFVSYWLKAAGMLYPYFVAIDVQWHMDRARWILEGQLPLLYGTNSPLNESTMPTAEWGANRPVIPYSPYFHMFATVFWLLPFPASFGANMFSALIDSLRVLLIALLALKIGLSRQTALLAALLYAALPVAFLLHAWGNIPTTFGLWLTLLATVVVVATWDNLHRRGPLLALSLILTATFLIYTVTAVFMGVFLLVFTLIVWLAARQGQEWRALLPKLRALWTAAGVAIGVVLIVYYGQYILPILERSVPYFGTVFTQGAQSVGVSRPPFSEYMYSFLLALDYRIWPGRYLFYGLALPLLFVIPATFTLWKRPLAATVFAAWFTVALLFMFVGYRISMVDKQLFYILPPICICWAIYAERYWQRGRWGKLLVISTIALSLFTALDQWIFRIAVSPVA